jgi:hypothetical protein
VSAADIDSLASWQNMQHRAVGFAWLHFNNGWSVSVSLWMPATISFLLAAVPFWKSEWRFSLRTLLIATTLVAVVLGLVAYAASK